MISVNKVHVSDIEFQYFIKHYVLVNCSLCIYVPNSLTLKVMEADYLSVPVTKNLGCVVRNVMPCLMPSYDMLLKYRIIFTLHAVKIILT
jgi:hypothetical protein